MNIYYTILFSNIVIELVFNLYYFNKFKNKIKIIFFNLILLVSLWAIFNSKLYLIIYSVYNYIQFEGRLISLTEFKLKKFIKILNIFCICYNLLNLLLFFKITSN